MRIILYIPIQYKPVSRFKTIYIFLFWLINKTPLLYFPKSTFDFIKEFIILHFQNAFCYYIILSIIVTIVNNSIKCIKSRVGTYTIKYYESINLYFMTTTNSKIKI